MCINLFNGYPYATNSDCELKILPLSWALFFDRFFFSTRRLSLLLLGTHTLVYTHLTCTKMYNINIFPVNGIRIRNSRMCARSLMCLYPMSVCVCIDAIGGVLRIRMRRNVVCYFCFGRRLLLFGSLMNESYNLVWWVTALFTVFWGPQIKALCPVSTF